MCLATGVDPTNDTAFTRGWESSASTASRSPCTTLKTPSGTPASASSSASIIDADGSCSEGLSTNVLPAASASGNIQPGTIDGKLKGVIPATTPTGWRSEKLSIPRETCQEWSPLSSCGSPQANSTSSSSRCTSPWASPVTLPCSVVTIRAISSRRACSSSRNANMIAVRFDRDVDSHAGAATTAACTAASTSSASANGTCATTSPVAEFVTSPWRPDRELSSRPSIQWLSSVSVVVIKHHSHRF